jgi:VIT1/CCC1 family predicted Fe2+/Mn2+ transporter
MPTVVRISDDLVSNAKMVSKVEKRSIKDQIEHWATIGKMAEENPELSYTLIKEILKGLSEIESGRVSDYQFD